jgi:dTDP-4-dehydrorhamnose 3,5-epimerase-like enzyme
MIPYEVIDETDKHIGFMNQDERGIVVSFAKDVAENFHVASMKPGAVRGNHTHDCDEVICIMGGRNICEITVEDGSSGTKARVLVDENIKTYRFKAGVKHTVQNIGEREFYLCAFLAE